MIKLLSLLSLSFLFSFSFDISAHDLEEGCVIQSEDRSPKNVLRDEYEIPFETLTFFSNKA